jgi:Holliday junction resolvasome RuvABC endonuclease subunit
VKGILVSGADPGFAHLGLGTLLRDNRGWRYVTSEIVDTSPIDGDDDERMRILWRSIEMLEGEVIAYEKQDQVLAAMQRLGHRNSRSDLVRDVMGLIRGRAFSLGAALIPVTPREMRSHLNLSSNATKQDMRRVLAQIVKDLPEGLSIHVTDALVATIVGERKYRAEGLLKQRGGAW